MKPHKLSRYIPPKVKFQIRSHCGFGCVICGCSIIQYHHFNPPFSEALKHEAKGITLLCGTCHDRVHKGIINKEEVFSANTKPYCKTKGNGRDFLFTGDISIPVQIGSSKIHSSTILMYDNKVIIGFNRPEKNNGPIRFNAIFTDSNSNIILQIINNEWIVREDCYDLQVIKSILKIIDNKKAVLLEMDLAVKNSIQIKKLLMTYKGFNINADNKNFSVKTPLGGSINHIGSNYSEIGVWMKSDGHALIASNSNGIAAIQL